MHLTGTPLFTTVMPTKILEAAAMRHPILLGVEGFAAQWIEAAECGVSFEPENASHFLEKLAVLQEDHELRKKMGDNGHRYVTQHNDRDDLAAAYLALLEQHVTAPTP